MIIPVVKPATVRRDPPAGNDQQEEEEDGEEDAEARPKGARFWSDQSRV